jgi:hypothetical protein
VWWKYLIRALRQLTEMQQKTEMKPVKRELVFWSYADVVLGGMAVIVLISESCGRTAFGVAAETASGSLVGHFNPCKNTVVDPNVGGKPGLCPPHFFENVYWLKKSKQPLFWKIP